MVDEPIDKRSTPAETIAPIPYRSPRQNRMKTAWVSWKWLTSAGLAMVLIGLAAFAGFVFTARQVLIQIDPASADITIRGSLLAPRFGDHYLLRPGKYTLQAEEPCYAPLEVRLVVGKEKRQSFQMTLPKLAGKLSVRAHPKDAPAEDIRGARVYLDGQEVGHTPLTELAVSAGVQRLEVRADRFQEFQKEVTVEGCGRLQESARPCRRNRSR